MKVNSKINIVLISIFIIICGCSSNKAEEAYNDAVARLESAKIEYEQRMDHLRAQGASEPELMIAEITFLKELSQLELEVKEKAEALRR